MKNNKKQNKKFDIKNLSQEDKVKFIGIAVIALVFCSFIAYGYYSNNSNEDENVVEEMSNPDAELNKYNTKLDAMNGKKDPNLANDLENTFSQTDMGEEESVNFDELDRQIANLGNPTPTSKEENTPTFSNAGVGGGGSRTAPQNSHNVYGNYDMWQTNEPKNNNIGYSNKSNNIPKKPKYEQPKIEYVETPMPTTTIAQASPAKQVAEAKQVKAKLISKGQVTTGRTLSFMLLESTTIAGQKTAKGQIITGVAQEQNNRLFVEFSSVKINDKVYPATIELIGSDGMRGLPIAQSEDRNNNGALENEVRNQAGNIVSRVPIVGGVLNSVTRTGSRNTTTNQSITLGSNITCYVMIY